MSVESDTALVEVAAAADRNDSRLDEAAIAVDPVGILLIIYRVSMATCTVEGIRRRAPDVSK